MYRIDCSLWKPGRHQRIWTGHRNQNLPNQASLFKSKHLSLNYITHSQLAANGTCNPHQCRLVFSDFQEGSLRPSNPLLLDDIILYEPSNCARGHIVCKGQPGLHNVDSCQSWAIVEILDKESADWDKAYKRAAAESFSSIKQELMTTLGCMVTTQTTVFVLRNCFACTSDQASDRMLHDDKSWDEPDWGNWKKALHLQTLQSSVWPKEVDSWSLRESCAAWCST